MRSRLTFALLALAALAALLPAATTAAATTAATAAPKLTKVSPMRLQVGGTLAIYGKNFSSRRMQNTVVFRSPSGRTAFAKPSRASRTKLVVKVPSSVARLMADSGGSLQPTRFKLRVFTSRASSYTIRRLSPVIVPNGSTAPDSVSG